MYSFLIFIKQTVDWLNMAKKKTWCWSCILGLGCFIILKHFIIKNKENKAFNSLIPEVHMNMDNRSQISLAYRYEKRYEKRDRVTNHFEGPLLPSTESHSIVFFNMPSWMSGDFPILNSTTCPNLSQECKVHTKNTHFGSSKGVIFYGEGLPGKVPQKKPGQAWLFFSIETPFLYSVNPQWKDKFFWTVTYRRDSDFNYFYGKIHKRDVPVKLFRSF